MSTDKAVMKKILDDTVRFWLDCDNQTNVFVEFKNNQGAVYFEPIGSTYFLAALGCRYREETGEDDVLPNFSELLAVKSQQVIFERQNMVSINHRVAGSLNSRIAYFLADEQRRTVVVEPDGWKIVVKAKEKFVKREADLPQVRPTRGGNCLTLLRPYVNLSDDDFKLLVIWLIQAFSRESSHNALVISSAKGTGKSTLTKLLRSLIDPSLSDASLTPSNDGDLKNLLANTFMACFDNTASMRENYSNILCAAITGTKESKRKLYTDCDQIILNLHNVVVLNGIDIVPYKSDLSERSLLFELQKITADKRMTDHDFWSGFQADKPAILGAIFDTLQKAMQILQTLQVKELARMADAYQEMVAIALALDIPQAKFERIYKANQGRLQASYIQNNPFIEFVVSYVGRRKRIDEPAQKLYEDMYECKGKGGNYFPDSPTALSRRLNLERDALEEAGISFSRHKRSDANYIRLEKIAQNQMTKKQKATAGPLASTDE